MIKGGEIASHKGEDRGMHRTSVELPPAPALIDRRTPFQGRAEPRLEDSAKLWPGFIH